MPLSDAMADPEPLVFSVHSSGREVFVIAYYDGKTPVDARLVFRTWEDAAECARVLKEAKRPAR